MYHNKCNETKKESSSTGQLGGIPILILRSGGSSPEVELSLRIREFGASLSGREQLAVYGFADAIDIVPKTLAENAGFDSINILIELKSEHEKGILEPIRVKVQAIDSATEASSMILKIDDVIAAGKEKLPEMPPSGGE